MDKDQNIKPSFIETELPNELNELPFLIFLDIDGVLNCEVFYHTASEKEKDNNICSFRINLLNQLCEETGAKIVISSTWKMGKSIDELQNIADKNGANFEIIGKTPNLKKRCDFFVPRGLEINQWIKEFIKEDYFGEEARDFQHSLKYIIIDDDSDMLLNQKKNFFHCDNYSGFTPNTLHKIIRFYKGLF